MSFQTKRGKNAMTNAEFEAMLVSLIPTLQDYSIEELNRQLRSAMKNFWFAGRKYGAGAANNQLEKAIDIINELKARKAW